jgi:uncharacterized membrane protein YfcA
VRGAGPLPAPFFSGCRPIRLGTCMTLTPAILAIIAVTVLGTSFLSGIFGIAGGMILMGVLLTLTPVATAMVLHGVLQATSNGWRAYLWRANIKWPLAARYLIGLVFATMLFAAVRFSPSQAVALIGLGISPFIMLAVPTRYVIQAEHRFGSELCGFICTASQFITGVSAPVLDTFYVRSSLDRREIIATKAACQVVTHLAKIVYFGGMSLNSPAGDIPLYLLACGVALSVIGTSLSRILFNRLSDGQFRMGMKILVMACGVVYLTQGLLALTR